jgi:hypothetical protein
LHGCPYCPKPLDKHGEGNLDSHQEEMRWTNCFTNGFKRNTA